jgi:hypothetical protein
MELALIAATAGLACVVSATPASAAASGGPRLPMQRDPAW